MKTILLRLIALGIVLSTFSGCATTDGNRTRAEGTAVGAGVLGGLGALVGALVCGKDCAAIGAGAGAVVGAGAGYLAGNAVAERKEEYVKNEDQLDEKINIVVQYNSDLNTYNEQTATRIQDLDQQVAKLKARYKAKKVKVAELKKKQDEIKSLISTADQQKVKMDKEMIALNEYRESISQAQDHDQAKLAKLDSEIGTLKKNIAMLDTSTKQLAKLNNSLTVRK